MQDKTLGKANALKKEIEELREFIHVAEEVWTGKLVSQKSLFKFKTGAYGIYSEKELNINTPLKYLLLKTLKSYLKDLEQEFEAL